jgi:hypothetical protein
MVSPSAYAQVGGALDEFLGIALDEPEAVRAFAEGAVHRQIALAGGGVERDRPHRCGARTRRQVLAAFEAGQLQHGTGGHALAHEHILQRTGELERQVFALIAILVMLVAREAPAERVGHRPHGQAGLLPQLFQPTRNFRDFRHAFPSQRKPQRP